jgi:ribosomal-protein-alanine N-acetyltransferase
MTVETARLLLRRLVPADLDAYYGRVYADPDVMRTLPPGGPLSRAEFDARAPRMMVEHWERHGFGPWVVVHKADGEVVGHCGLRYWPETTDVEVLYALGRDYWGRGLATEAARASLRHGFETLGLDRIIAAAFADNVASRRVLERIGLRQERTFEFAGRPAIGYALSRVDYRPIDQPDRAAPG